MKIDKSRLILIAPDNNYRESFIEADRENEAAGIKEFVPLTDYERCSKLAFTKFILRLENYKFGVNLKKGYVPFTSFWLVDPVNRFFIGQCSLRHILNDNLRTFGGHIGYGIRPSCFGKGYATELLHRVLPEAKKIGITTVRLTCFAENKASARVMEKNGGIKIDEVINSIYGKERLTYIYEINTDDI